MKITVLGSGTSHGIPVVGCSCPVCNSSDTRDKRMRASVYVEGERGEKALIDAGPEFRLQALRAGISVLDGLFLTHAHADHIHGLDDLRPLSGEKPISVYGNKETIAEMKERFSYVFGSKQTQHGGGKPKLKPVVVEGPVQLGSLVFTPIPVKHGVLDILGWEVQGGESWGCFLYLTDISAIPPASLMQLKNSGPFQTIIIGGLRKRPHETHFTFEEALNTALGLEAERIYLTHICHEHSHAEIEGICRSFLENPRPKIINIHPAWDGLELRV